MKARDYQIGAVQSIFNYFLSGKAGNPLIAMPTGTGKSVVIAEFMRQIFLRWPGQKVVIATHVKELVEQNFDKLVRMWPGAPAGINSAGLGKRDYEHRIIFAGIGSVYKDAEAFGRVDLLLIDECHLLSPGATSRYQRFIGELRQRNPYLKVIGFTATPYRLGAGHIAELGTEEGGIFTDVCFDLCSMDNFNWLIDQGYLCTLTAKKTGLILDTKGVRLQGGEFNAGQLEAAINKDSITTAAVEEMIAGGGDRRSWLVFCAGVDHTLRTAAILNHYGIKTAAIHGKLPAKGKDGRDYLLAAYKAGEYRCATNNNILTTGFDHPFLDFIGVLRPTMSSTLWVQILGRGTRTDYAPGFDLDTQAGRLAAIQASGKHDCLVYDFANNTKRLGPINDPVLPRKKGQGGGGEAPVKVCPACQAWVHASASECPHCGHEFPRTVKIQEAASTIAVVKGDAPKTEVFKVDHLSVNVHNKLGKPPSLKVSYYCGLRYFTEWVGFENPATRGLAAMWWKPRAGGLPLPATTHEAAELASRLLQPTHIRVWTNKKPYAQVMAHDFTGTAFGAETAPELVVRPYVQVGEETGLGRGRVGPAPATQDAAPAVELVTDDDIPF